ncbi:hypothetical protein Salat_1025300 [Sesamum alatum]|uniref:Uncharacterized protein n=1 Tax=Sesamum alatum TaxID=300844 RepID=A0AAE1YMQ4_9LAMI|nr:hypothetical protein Salat_1025300 [Sesamum alatum]
MDSSLGTGFMAVFAASGSVVLLAMQVHKRLLSNFMKQMEFEFKNSTVGMKEEPKKKVRFADDETVADQRSSGKKYMSRPAAAAAARKNNDQNLEAMPENWQVMYRGILQYRNLRGYN